MRGGDCSRKRGLQRPLVSRSPAKHRPGDQAFLGPYIFGYLRAHPALRPGHARAILGKNVCVSHPAPYARIIPETCRKTGLEHRSQAGLDVSCSELRFQPARQSRETLCYVECGAYLITRASGSGAVALEDLRRATPCVCQRLELSLRPSRPQVVYRFRPGDRAMHDACAFFHRHRFGMYDDSARECDGYPVDRARYAPARSGSRGGCAARHGLYSGEIQLYLIMT